MLYCSFTRSPEMLRHFVLFSFLCWCSTSSKEIPSFVHLCKRSDPGVAECFINTIYEIMPYLIKGIPEMDIPSIDPLGFNTIKVDTGNGGAVSMVIELVNGSASGLQDLVLKNHVMDFDKIRFSADLTLPHMKINAIYRVRGKILLFELNGEGQCSFNASEITTNGVWTGSTYTKKNRTHLNIDKIVFNDVKIKHIRIRLHNLFGENEALTDTVNKAVNDNIESLQDELEPLIKETLAEIIRDYFNRVYRQFPMDQLYPND